MVSLGTTNVPLQDGRFCSCALGDDGRVVYEIKTEHDIPPGVVLQQEDGGSWTPTKEHLDVAAFAREVLPAIPIWKVVPGTLGANSGRPVLRYTAGAVLGGRVQWFPSEPGTPRSPACSWQDIRGLIGWGGDRSQVTEVVELGVAMQLINEGNNRYYESIEILGRFRCKYNGKGPAPRFLRHGTLIGIFASDHAYNLSLKAFTEIGRRLDVRLDRYWYVKFGSILGLGTLDARTLHLCLEAVRNRQRIAARYFSVVRGEVQHLNLFPQRVAEQDGCRFLMAIDLRDDTSKRYPLEQILGIGPVPPGTPSPFARR